MQVGVVFPQTEIGADPGGIRAYAEAVEALGFEHVIVYDHVLGADPEAHAPWTGAYTYEEMFHEPFALFGFIAAVAPRLELATAVIIAPQRQTALLAKQAAEIDVLTNGRFRLGLGLGWNAVEYEALGVPFSERGRRLEEQIDVLRRLFRDPLVTYEGRWHTITAAGINPLPTRPSLPIWIGGSAEAALRRAARIADGLFLVGQGEPQAMVEKVRGWVAEEGRDPEAFGIEGRLTVKPGRGTEDWEAKADRWREVGATHLSINTMGSGLRGADAHIECLQRVAAALLVP